MPKPKPVPSYDQVVSTLGNRKFDASPAGAGSGALRVSKYGCAAEIAPSGNDQQPVRLVTKPGFLVGNEIAGILDRGYQKFFKTSRLEVPATADALRALHRFSEELADAAETEMLYNESLGTTSDRYDYDRVKGRETAHA